MSRSSARLIAKASGSGRNAAPASFSAQPDNISIPQVNPELDKQLNFYQIELMGDAPNLAPRFPAFHGLQPTDMFRSEDAFKAYRSSFQGQPNMAELREILKLDRRPWYEDVYNSIIETRYARVHDESRPVDRNRTTGNYYYGPQLILAITSKLVVQLISCLHFGVVESNDEVQEPIVENISFVQRHRELCLVLLFEKDIVEEILSGDEQTITNLVAGPASYALRKDEVRNSWVAAILAASRASGSSRGPNLPMPRRNKSIPAYPTYSDALHTLPQGERVMDWGATYLASLDERFPPNPGEPVDWLKQNKLQLVMKLYDAIRSVSDLRSDGDGINGAHFIKDLGPKLSPRTTHKTIQKASWEIVMAFLDAVEHGLVKPKMPNRRDARPLTPGSEDVPWKARFSTMLTILSRRKALCWRLVKSRRGLECFIADPLLYRNLGMSDRQ